MSALICAITLITLYFASIWPTGRIGLVALASVLAAAAVIEAGILSGIYVFVASSLLAVIVIPEKSSALLYILFFGYYPVAKSLIERIRGKSLQWVLKLLLFNLALTVILLLLREMIFGTDAALPGNLLLYIGCNVVFILFDYGFTKVIWLYIERVSRYFKKT